MTRTLRARAVLPGPSGRGSVATVRLTLADGLIAAIDPLPDDAEVDLPHVLVPGFIDLQMNGLDEYDLWTLVEENDVTSWSSVEQALLDQGVTTWCPTFVSAPRDRYERLPAFLDRLAHRPDSDPRPEIMGVHLEGPFLGSAVGAHSPEAISDPDPEWVTSFGAMLHGRLALMTIGAESDLAARTCRNLIDLGVRVSLGHTIPNRSQYETMCRAGAGMVTHLFNGMGGIGHREAGLAAWALADDDLWCGLIADGIHVDPSWIAVAFRAKPSRLFLVTDRVAHRRPGLSSDGRSVRRRDGVLAGSLLTMPRAIRNCIELGGISLPTAVFAATANPARAMNWNDRGLIAVGCRADLVALDDQQNVSAVWMHGRRIR